jgi:hypothetical protein
VLAGSNYSLVGGFWAVAALPTPVAPFLSIMLTSTNTVLISWPAPSTGFILQQNLNLGNSGGWSAAPETVGDNGVTKSVIVNPPVGNYFYRLKN